MNKTLLLSLTLAALLLGGCMGHAEDTLPPAEDEALEVVPADVWVHAPAGCEGVSLSRFSRARVSGAPSLGALVAHGPDGRRVVRCVDSDAQLRFDFELPELTETTLLGADPSPQPSVDEYGDDARNSEVYGGDSEPDPTPTPLTEEDPTPTPMNEGDTEEDPTPTPMQPVWLVWDEPEGGR